MLKFLRNFILIILFSSFCILLISCNKENTTLAPYTGSPKLSGITIEKGSFKPKATWLGGYVSVFAVNKGTKAALDTSIIWLIHTSGNDIKYPLKFGEVPSGAQDITTQYGGSSADSLSEDETYTYWILKEDAWNQISNQSNARLYTDSNSTASSVIINADSISISQFSFISATQPNDVFINLSNVSQFGRLAAISVKAEKTNIPIIKWLITEAGLTDSSISAIGLVEGAQYQSSNALWEIYSEDDSAGVPIYGKKNVISQPVKIGQKIPGTHEFVEFTLDGLERNKDYYIWIANKDWDGTTRLRFAVGYAWATFNVK
ncbi:MAG: hypothetical protein ABI550_09085 [Ignavibacteriaceae bacterium]